MNKPVILLAVFGLIIGALPAVATRSAEAAPPSPELLRTLEPAEIADLPREPVLPPGVARLAGEGTAGRRRTGHPRVLVILVDFDDRPAERTVHTPAAYRRLLFSRGEADTVSLRDYFLEASYGRFDVTGEVVGWYRMPSPYASYPGGNSGLCRACWPHNARALAADAVRAAVEDGVDFTRFDNDGPDGAPGSGDDDGILDGLLVVYPGYGAERTGRSDDLRSHYWTMTTMTRVGSVSVPDYAMFSGDDHVGVAIHEFGHVLGGEDLYDVSAQGNGLGNFSVMAYGMWLVDATHPTGPDPFTRIEWGFAEPTTLIADAPDLDIPAVGGEPFVLKLWTRGEAGPEYFLAENRRRTGIDDYLPTDGLLVYHVDTATPAQSDPRRYRIRVVEADGHRSLEGEFPRNLGDPGDAFPGALGVRDLAVNTRPDTRANDGTPTGVAIRRIGKPGPVMRAAVAVGRDLGREPRLRLDVLPSGGPLADLPAEGGAVRLRLINRGPRLPAGTLRLVPAPALDISGPAAVEMEALNSFETRDTGPLWTIRERPGTPGPGAPVVLEAIWESPGRDYDLAAPLPTGASVRGREGFERGSVAVRTAAVREGAPQTWKRESQRAASGDWAYRARAVPGWTSAAGADGGLVLGPYELSGNSELCFEHSVSTRSYGDYALDGGFLELSTDGGATWRMLVPDGGYPMTFALADGNPYPGTAVWGGRLEAWEPVRVPLIGVEGSTLFRFHYVAAYGEDTDLYDGWTVDDVVVRSWDPPFAATLDAAPAGNGRIRFDVHVRPVVDEDAVGEVRLVRERGGESLLLAVIPFRGRQDLVEWLVDGVSGTTARYDLRWGPDLASRTPPITIQADPPRPGGFPDGVPAVIHTRRGEWITYQVAEASEVALDLFDVRGRRAARLVRGSREPGTYRVIWPPLGEDGRRLGSGVYFLRLAAGSDRETRRVTLLP